MNLKYKITTAIATGTMMAALVVPSAFAAPISIDHNGAGSVNGALVVKASKSKVRQRNTTIVGTHVFAMQNTGGNTANGNVGGGNTITTGKNTTTTNVTVAGGSNTNTAESCCCDGQGGTIIDINHNGAGSVNGALVIDLCKNVVKQSNTTIVGTSVTSISNTGGNTANGNVGGTNGIDTGDNVTTTTVNVTGSSNSN